MKKSIKIVSVLLIVAMALITLSTSVYAAGDLINSMKPSYTDTGDIAGVGQKIASIISTVGIVVAVIILLILGIKYMIGSASEKAEYKKTMIPYLVGAVLVFGASAIAKVVVNMASTITTTGA